MTMPDEIKKLLEKQGKAFEEFKTANDARLKALEKDGSSDPVLDQKVDKANEDITAIMKQITELEAKTNRPSRGEGNEKSQDVIDHEKGFERFFRKGDEAGLADLEQKALSANSDPDGGFTVPEEVDRNITRVVSDFSPIRGLATVRKIGTAAYKKIVSMGGASCGWVGEEDARTETGTPTLKELLFNAMEIYAEPRATQELLDDSFMDIGGWLADEVSIEFGEQESAAFVTGNGVKKPRGFLAYTNVANASYTWGNIGFILSGGAGTFATSNPGDNLIDLVHSLKSGYRKNAKFLMNDLTIAAARKLKDGDGNYLWQQSLLAGAPSTLLGYAVVTAEDMPDIAANSMSIAFGDFNRGYLIIDRLGVRVLRDPYTLKPYIKFYTTKRVGGGVQNFEAIKLLKFAAS